MTSSVNNQPESATFGKYTILEFLGKGGMAEVYKAKLHGIGGFEKVVVIKKILPHLASSESFIKMFFDEAKITVALHHPNIVQVFDLGQVDGTYYMAMEYVNGPNLNMLVKSCTARQSRIPFKHVIFIIMEVCRALHYAHTATDSSGTPLHIIHRDVTHSNILLSFGGDVKLADFGIARARIQESQEKPGRLKGKMGYMAPEMFRREEIDHRIDIFALGILFYELLTMSKLFHGQNDEEVVRRILSHDVEKTLAAHPTLPDDIQDILRKALAFDRDKRYATAQEFYTDLSDFIFNNGIQTTPHEFAEFLGGMSGLAREIAAAGSVTGASLKSTPLSPSRVSSLCKWSSVAQQELSINVGGMQKSKPAPHVIRWLTVERTVPQAAVVAKPDYEGELQNYHLPRLLCRMALGRAGGKLKLTSAGMVKSLFMEEGRILSVLSSLPEESMERCLIERTSLPLEEIEEAARLFQGDAIARWLMKGRADRGAEIQAAVGDIYATRLAGIIRAQTVRYEFFKGESVSERILECPIETFELLAAAARQALTYSDLLQALDGYLDFSLVSADNPHIGIEQAFLNDEEVDLLATVPLGERLRDILDAEAEMERKTTVARVIYLLYQYEIVKFVVPTT